MDRLIRDVNFWHGQEYSVGTHGHSNIINFVYDLLHLLGD